MYDLNEIDIRFIDSEDWERAMSLSYETFLRFDASEFTEEGIANFRDFVSDNFLKRLFENGSYQVIGAYYRGRMIGVISLKDGSHISLLFVNEDFQKIGVGRALVLSLADYAKLKLHTNELSVNASPYATEFYHKVGFTDVGPMVNTSGISYTPMKYII